MIEVATDLLGDTVEISEYHDYGDGTMGYPGYHVRARGTVRALYINDGSLMVLVEHNLGSDSIGHGDRTMNGGLEVYSLRDHRVRVVKRCRRCSALDQTALMVGERESSDSGLTWTSWEHRVGEGCKKNVAEHQGEGG